MMISGKVPKKHMQALNYFAEQLFTPQKRRHLYLTIKYRKNLEHLGMVSIDDYNVLGMPIGFEIEILRQSEAEMLKTLAHEMVHVLQYARGELNEQMTLWRGKKVNAEKIPYFEQPWEIEAETTANFLYESYISSKT